MKTFFVTISNGFNKFHLSVAASEANASGVLYQFITGAYPNRFVVSIVSFFHLTKNRKFARLLDRGEGLPLPKVFALWFSESVYQIGMLLRRFGPLQPICEWLNISSLKLYGLQAMKYIKQVSPHTKIYHYRAGFGGHSVKSAKEQGMIAICDHSIAHPSVLDYLVNNNGQMPPMGSDCVIKRIWRYILWDIQQADTVLVNSDFVKETFLHYGCDSSRIHVIYWGVDDQFLSYIPESSGENSLFRNKVRLFASSIEPRKGVDTLIPALEKIYDLPWLLEIAGSISSEVMARYRNFLNSTRVTLAGLLRRYDLAQRMSTADVFIFPSLAEGSARIVFEALACGCYVITTPNSGTIVQDGIHGALVPPGNVDALEAAIRLAINNPDKVAEIGQRNAELIRISYTQKNYGNKLLDLYEKV